MNLFIDTNIYLSLYHYTSDALEELRKLEALIKTKKIVLFLPEQTRHEFDRNREVKIQDAIKRVTGLTLKQEFPRLCHDYAEYKKLRDSLDAVSKAHASLVAILSKDAGKRGLRADKLLDALFSLATPIPTTPQVVAAARDRSFRGDPPGKGSSAGDAINWESLLAAVPVREDLYFIADDGDYASPLDASTFLPMLTREWATRKSSSVEFFRSLSSFFAREFSDIKLTDDIETDITIRDLATSGSFAQTHTVVTRIAAIPDFSKTQANAIIEAACSNPQVFRIITDTDVQELVEGLLERFERDIDPVNVTKIRDEIREEKRRQEETRIEFLSLTKDKNEAVQ